MKMSKCDLDYLWARSSHFLSEFGADRNGNNVRSTSLHDRETNNTVFTTFFYLTRLIKLLFWFLLDDVGEEKKAVIDEYIINIKYANRPFHIL